MLEAIAVKVITILLGAISGWFLKVFHLWTLKKAAEKETQKAIQDAKDQDNTSGIFAP